MVGLWDADRNIFRFDDSEASGRVKGGGSQGRRGR
jgi:hypothetical protein